MLGPNGWPCISSRWTVQQNEWFNWPQPNSPWDSCVANPIIHYAIHSMIILYYTIMINWAWYAGWVSLGSFPCRVTTGLHDTVWAARVCMSGMCHEVAELSLNFSVQSPVSVCDSARLSLDAVCLVAGCLQWCSQGLLHASVIMQVVPRIFFSGLVVQRECL